MADEEIQVSDADASADGQNDGANEQSVHDLQARATKAEQKAAQLQQELDSLQPYVRFDAQEEKEATAKPEKPQKSQVDDFQAVLNQVGQLKLDLFYSRNADLEEHRELFEGAFLQTDSRKDGDQRLREAAKKVRDTVEAIRKKAVTEDQTKREKAKKAAAETDGIVGGGSTAPEAPAKEEGWSQEDYAAARRKQQQQTYGAG